MRRAAAPGYDEALAQIQHDLDLLASSRPGSSGGSGSGGNGATAQRQLTGKELYSFSASIPVFQFGASADLRRATSPRTRPPARTSIQLLPRRDDPLVLLQGPLHRISAPLGPVSAFRR